MELKKMTLAASLKIGKVFSVVDEEKSGAGDVFTHDFPTMEEAVKQAFHSWTCKSDFIKSRRQIMVWVRTLEYRDEKLEQPDQPWWWYADGQDPAFSIGEGSMLFDESRRAVEELMEDLENEDLTDEEKVDRVEDLTRDNGPGSFYYEYFGRVPDGTLKEICWDLSESYLVDRGYTIG